MKFYNFFTTHTITFYINTIDRMDWDIHANNQKKVVYGVQSANWIFQLVCYLIGLHDHN